MSLCLSKLYCMFELGSPWAKWLSQHTPAGTCNCTHAFCLLECAALEAACGKQNVFHSFFLNVKLPCLSIVVYMHMCTYFYFTLSCEFWRDILAHGSLGLLVSCQCVYFKQSIHSTKYYWDLSYLVVYCIFNTFSQLTITSQGSLQQLWIWVSLWLLSQIQMHLLGICC